MNFSIDESIRTLKAEILAQDWRLPPRRIEPLEASFACLKQRFNTRKHTLAILGMAEAVIQYLKKRETVPDPLFIDFLKEAMAHVVNIYEEGKFDPEREAILCNRIYGRFNILKEKIKAEKGGSGASAPAEVSATVKKEVLPEETSSAPPAAAPPENPLPEPVREPAPEPSSEPPPEASPPPPPLEAPPKAAIKTGSTLVREYNPKPGTLFQPFSLSGMPMAVAVEHIALLEKVKPARRRSYIKNNLVPLKDFTSFWGRLAGRFQGALKEMGSVRLRKMSLPLMVPHGVGLPLGPEEGADHLLVITAGNWHGTIICSVSEPANLMLSRFQVGRNGDIAGLGIMDDDSSVPLLNPGTLLEREGFLALR